MRRAGETSAAAARSSSHSVRSTPCTPAAGSCTGPAPRERHPHDAGLLRSRGDQPHLLGRVDRRQGERDPVRRRLRGCRVPPRRDGFRTPPDAPGRSTRRDRPRPRRAAPGRSGGDGPCRAGPTPRARPRTGPRPPPGRRHGRTVRGRHRVHPGGVERQGVEQRGTGLGLVAVRVPGRQESLVAPPDVHPAPVDRVAGRAVAHRLVDPVGDPTAGEHDRGEAPGGLGVDQPHDQPGRGRLREHVRVG